MPKIEILWITENYFPNKGGMAQSCDRIVYNLRQAGIKVHVLYFSSKSGHEKLKILQNGSEKIITLAYNIEHTLYMTNLFIERESTYKEVTHIVAFGGNMPLFYAPMLSKFLNKSLILCFRGNDFDIGIFSPKKRETLFYALQNAQAVACVSSDKCKMIRALLPHLAVYHTPNGLDKKNWRLLPSDIKKAEEFKNKIDPTQRIIGLFGHLKIKKGLSFFLKALENAPYLAQIHLLLIGQIEDESIMKQLEKMGISYTILPFLERYELLSYYYACHILAIPSFYDGMPNVLLEGALLQKTFIASDVAGMYDVLKDNKNAFVFEVNQLKSARSAIDKFMQNSLSQIEKMGQNLYEKVIQEYTEAQEIQNYLTIFQNH